MTWPDGYGSALRLDGAARDALTLTSSAPPLPLTTSTMRAEIGPDREITFLETSPCHPQLQQMLGSRGGGHLRRLVDELVPTERDAGSTLYLLLDDISGSSLIAGFAWSRWRQTWMTATSDDRPSTVPHAPNRAPQMEGICIGFRPGSSALRPDGTPYDTHRVQPVGALVNVEDPHGWHALAELPPVSMRRARRIDVWVEAHVGEEIVVIDSAFQDSAGDPDHGRIAVHEYVLRATADRRSLTLRSVEAEPRVLPYPECPSAAANATAMIGTPLAELRSAVLGRLSKTNGCTHLNDALRALAEVPQLVKTLLDSI
ncbi:MAG: hypothetical protein JWM34_3955 [Ilumatobacteraceae bacterium]|nr:hypothetical protein [Ilumatobacteraceae bacterium]